MSWYLQLIGKGVSVRQRSNAEVILKNGKTAGLIRSISPVTNENGENKNDAIKVVEQCKSL